ncbi:MAG: dockerin type I repeat-containing protein [candidate division Zixibacteria bacterium]|nr:dockerin type I repeat-containing protein [candidate division Zixibacteria bacterium]
MVKVELFLRGDANGDGVWDIGDVVFLINYLYKGDPPPFPLDAGDANCDGVVDIGDVVYLINYLFRGGDPPGCD